MLWTILTATAAGLLGFANGANDNAKGVATLIGGGIMRQRPAIWFAAATTFAGSLAAVLLASTLIARFAGKGIVEPQIAAMVWFPVCVGMAAAVTVLLATRLGMPISTTHAMVGGIVGVGLASGSLNVGAVVMLFLLPLLVSPWLAVLGAAGLYVLIRKLRIASGVTRESCLCVGREVYPLALARDGTATGGSMLTLSVASGGVCRERYVGSFGGVNAQQLLTVSHLASAGALSFARGLNDTPKIAALLLAGHLTAGVTGSATVALAATGLAIALGGLLAVRRVAATMSERITDMNEGQSFTANAVAAALVIVASRFGLPVSTTHVTCGSLFGIGAVNGCARWGMILRILVAWVTTLPLAAGLAALAWWGAAG